MITLKSKFYNFINKQGIEVTNEDLDNLKQLISTDIINFRGNISYGFTPNIAKQIIQKISDENKNIKICIINDTTLHMLLSLLHEGFKLPKIYVAIGKWQQNGKEIKPSNKKKEDKTYKIFKKHVETSFNEKINVISLEEMFNMKFDLIIANPPYGKIGANITKKIIDEVDFKEYVNLLPANDYKRNDTKDLYNYQSDMEPVNDGFTDAAVTTHLAKIYRTKVNNMTEDEFTIAQYIDKSLNKFFIELINRKNYALDNSITPLRLTVESAKLNPSTSIIIGMREVNHKHLPYSKNCDTYKWNVLKSITVNDIVNLHPEKKTANEFTHQFIVFNTTAEKDNMANFMYSANGFRFISKLFTAVNIDSATKAAKVFPKVDWTRNWTVEEILKDYGYTEEEIAEVMADLDNFKGMEN